MAVFAAPSAEALPAFARQTGQPCGNCHTAIPELRPYGRLFKLGGYQESSGDMMTPQLALWTLQGFTNTRADQDAPPVPRSKVNNNIGVQEFHAFVAGKITEGLGGFIQWAYDPYYGHLNFDDTDVRYVKTFDNLFGKEATIGLLFNNAPTFQDVWNTTNSWSWPQFSSNFAAFQVPNTFIDNLDQQVAGAGMYLWWNNLLYLEGSAYRGLNRKALTIEGQFPGDTPDLHPGTLPYWRAAFQPHWGDHYLMLGTFGMYGNVIPQSTLGSGTDKYLDVGFDAQYQYDGDQFQFTLKGSNIYEKQRLDASSQIFGWNTNNWLNSFKINATSIWDHTYSFSGGYFNVKGSADAVEWGQSVTGSPNGDGLTFDASYFPFSKGHAPGPDAQFNMRIGVQYTKYLHLYGGTDNAINATGGTRNARGNDTLWVYALTAF